MAPRPFARRHKDGEAEAELNAPNMIDLFFADAPEAASPPEAAQPAQSAPPVIPDVAPYTPAAAGSDAGSAATSDPEAAQSPAKSVAPSDVKGDAAADDKAGVRPETKAGARPETKAGVSPDTKAGAGDGGKAEVHPAAAPEATMPDGAQAGWYPDSTNPGLMRYWDGFHLTGQVLHVHARAEDRDPGVPPRKGADEVKPPAASSPPAGLPAPSQSGRGPFDRPRSLAGGEKPGPRPGSWDTRPAEDPSPSTPAVSAMSRPTQPLSGTRLGENGATGSVAHRPGDTDRDKDPRLTGPLAAAVIKADKGDKERDKGEKDRGERDKGERDKGERDKGERDKGERDKGERADASDKANQGNGAKADEVAKADEAATPGGSGKADEANRGNGTDKGDRDKGGRSDGLHQPVDASGRPKDRPADDEVRNWAAMTETAVARAKAVDTPEAWQQAAQAAAVVSEMAETMQVVSEATQRAEQKARDAEEAERRARRAAQADAEAKEAVRRTSKAAEEAGETARAAARGAAEAERKAQELRDIVAAAHRANTPEAWRKALKQAGAPAAQPR